MKITKQPQRVILTIELSPEEVTQIGNDLDTIFLQREMKANIIQPIPEISDTAARLLQEIRNA